MREAGERAGKRVVMTCTGETRTNQQFEMEADINFIVQKYMKTGVLPGNSNKVPEYADQSTVGYGDLLASYEAVEKAEVEFAALEPAVRRVCKNDPALFLQMVDTVEGSALLQEAGLDLGGSRYEPEPEPKPVETPPVVGGE